MRWKEVRTNEHMNGRTERQKLYTLGINAEYNYLVFSLFHLFALRHFVFSRGVISSFRYFVFSRGVISSFRVTLFRLFVISSFRLSVLMRSSNCHSLFNLI